MVFTVSEHKHRFAVWAASRAGSVKGCRFTVEQGKTLIDAAGLRRLKGDPTRLPRADRFDVRHAQWRGKVIAASKKIGLSFTHGVAAKLVNIYLKTVFVVGGHHIHERVGAIHPPIDDVLLKQLAANNVGGQGDAWKCARARRWSKLDSEQYQEVINAVRIAMGGAPLWQIEEHWRGFQ